MKQKKSFLLILLASIALTSCGGGQPTVNLEATVNVQATLLAEPDKLESASSTPVPITKTSIPPENSVWDFNVRLNQDMGSDGFINDASREYNLVVRLNLTEDQITGEYIGASGNACSDATINGTIQNNVVYFVIYYSGGCCGGNEMEFIGTFDGDKSMLTGTLEPVDIPVGSCILWFADVTATRRE